MTYEASVATGTRGHNIKVVRTASDGVKATGDKEKAVQYARILRVMTFFFMASIGRHSRHCLFRFSPDVRPDSQGPSGGFQSTPYEQDEQTKPPGDRHNAQFANMTLDAPK